MRVYSDKEVNELVYGNMDALLIISAKEDKYKVIRCSSDFAKVFDSEGSYNELIEKSFFHLNENNGKITDDYLIFLPKMGEFKGKYSKKINLDIEGERHSVMMMVCPIKNDSGEYLMIFYDLDKSELIRKEESDYKTKTMQETYLFSMYVDLNKDATSSINVTEISNDDMHYDVKYSEWRMMIVNMIWPENQAEFLEKTDPSYLKSHLNPGKTLSFDCQMKNLEGVYIWVKLIFGRTDTTSDSDFRFVFMVENIHDSSMKLFNELKKFENLALYDTLTGVFNHGRIETEMNNGIEECSKTGEPISFMMIDIDYFKNVNDTYGHATGDEVLKKFVHTVCEVMDKYNIKIGRWGGEEFVCVCYGVTLDEACIIAENMRTKVENRIFEKIGSMTCSIGLACYEDDDNASGVFQRLDKALYEAKSAGRNCVRMLRK